MRTELLSFFYLLLCCQAAESLTKKLVILGQDVTLDCDLDVKDVYWLFLKPPDSLVMILRTFTAVSTTPIVYDERLKNKYSSQTNSRLFISNITTDELGTYYCAKHGLSPQLGNGTKLHINETLTPPQDPNQCNHQPQPQITGILLSVIYLPLMAIAIIGVLQIKLKTCGKISEKSQDDELQQLYNTNTDEFSEVELRLCERHSARLKDF